MGSAIKIAWNGPILASTACALNQVKTLVAPISGSPVNPKKSDATGVPMKNPGDASGIQQACLRARPKKFRKTYRQNYRKLQNCSLRNVLQLATVPDFRPVVNHCERCAEVP
jgi:hypothetical protein